MNIKELLQLRGLDTSRRIKLVRHKDKRYDLDRLRRDGHFERYQSYQSKPVFDCDMIVSFLGMRDSRAQFYGVYGVKACRPSSDVPLPAGFPYPQFNLKNGVCYELEEIPGFEDFKDRVVIDWGKGAINWHQWLSEKAVTEVRPKGRIHPFPGHLEFVLGYHELVEMVRNKSANRDWHLSLGSVAGVYLIIDATDGRHYIGSATGEEGILGRWRAYVETGHGDNKVLRRLLAEKGPGHATNFQFTILATLPRGLTRMKALEQEELYKRKLGSRAHGLNT